VNEGATAITAAVARRTIAIAAGIRTAQAIVALEIGVATGTGITTRIVTVTKIATGVVIGTRSASVRSPEIETGIAIDVTIPDS